MENAINHSLKDRDLEFGHGLVPPPLVPDHLPHPPPTNKTLDPKNNAPKIHSPMPNTHETLKESKDINEKPTSQEKIEKIDPHTL